MQLYGLKLKLRCPAGSNSPAGSQRSAGVLSSEWWRLRLQPHLKLQTDTRWAGGTARHITGCVRSPEGRRLSPRWVICSGIWTGICSAASGPETGLQPLLSSSRARRIWSEEEEGLPGRDAVCDDVISSSRPFRRTGTANAKLHQ